MHLDVGGAEPEHGAVEAAQRMGERRAESSDASENERTERV